MKPFFTNGTDVALQGLKPAPELRRLLADGGIFLAGLSLVVEVGLGLGLPLPQEQVLALLFVAFGLSVSGSLGGNLRFVIGDKITLGERRRAPRIIRIDIVSLLVSIRRGSWVIFFLLVDEGLIYLLVLDEISGGIVERSVCITFANPKVGIVDGFPSAIQTGKGGNDSDDALKGM